MFAINKNMNGKYDIECSIFYLNEKFKDKYPDFLESYKGSNKWGYNTKFVLLVEKDLDLDTALELVMDLDKKYSKLISKCYDTNDWSQFPFKDAEIIFYK